MSEIKFTAGAEEVLRLSQEAAGELGHSYVGGKCEDCGKKDPAANPPIVNIIRDVVETVVNVIKPTLENIFNKIFWWR